MNGESECGKKLVEWPLHEFFAGEMGSLLREFRSAARTSELRREWGVRKRASGPPHSGQIPAHSALTDPPRLGRRSSFGQMRTTLGVAFAQILR